MDILQGRWYLKYRSGGVGRTLIPNLVNVFGLPYEDGVEGVQLNVHPV